CRCNDSYRVARTIYGSRNLARGETTMSDVGVIGRVSLVQSTIIRVSLDIGSKGFTKVGPDGLQTVGVVNSYITAPAGAHRVVAIVTGVSIVRGNVRESGRDLLSEDDQAEYELEAAV